MTAIPCNVSAWFCDFEPRLGVTRIRAHAEAERKISVEICMFDGDSEKDVVWDSLRNHLGIKSGKLPSYYTKLQRQIEELTGEESGLFHCWLETESKSRQYYFAVRAHRTTIAELIHSQSRQHTATLFQFHVPYLFDEAVSNFGHAIVTEYGITQKTKVQSSW